MFKSFRIPLRAVLTAAILLTGVAAEAAAVDAAELLKRSDQFRNGWPAFVFQLKITNFDNGRAGEESLFEIYQKGSEKTLVKFLSPRDKGRQMLMLSDDMWLYLPSSSRPVRITPLERLSGAASSGDIARTNYAIDYAATYVGREQVGAEECHVLELTAQRKGATYQRVRYWVRTADARPAKAEFYLASGKHAKTATFDSYTTANGRTVLQRMTIHDHLRRDAATVLEYSQMTPRQLPDRLFHQSRGEQF